jgi:hypothetical protein
VRILSAHGLCQFNAGFAHIAAFEDAVGFETIVSLSLEVYFLVRRGLCETMVNLSSLLERLGIEWTQSSEYIFRQ